MMINVELPIPDRHHLLITIFFIQAPLEGSMHLTAEEERVLEGEAGEAESFAMKILVNLGELEGAEGFVPIRSAHISGVSYHTAGDALIKLLEELHGMGARISVPSSLNPAGMDLERWKEIGYPGDFAEKQLRIIELYRKLGIDITCSCIPYETPHRMEPISFGDHLAWGESNAVIYANSIVGARTNREGGISALAAAILGRTPDYGMHGDENRYPTLVVNILGRMDPLHFNLLGAFIGESYNSQVPYFTGIDRPVVNGDLKQLGAALAAKGGHSIFHVKDLTPEHGFIDISEREGLISERITITTEELEEAKDDLYPPPGRTPDVFVLGCPQFGISEFQRLYRAVKGRKLRKEKRMIVYTNRALREMLDPTLIPAITASGVEVYDDTCMVVSPLDRLGFSAVGTDSAKAAHYIPKMSRIPADLMPLEIMVDLAFE